MENKENKFLLITLFSNFCKLNYNLTFKIAILIQFNIKFETRGKDLLVFKIV